MIFRSQSKSRLQVYLDAEPVGSYEYKFVSQPMCAYWIAIKRGK